MVSSRVPRGRHVEYQRVKLHKGGVVSFFHWEAGSNGNGGRNRTWSRWWIGENAGGGGTKLMDKG